MNRVHYGSAILAFVCIVQVSSPAAETAPATAPGETLTAQWEGDYKILKYKNREFVVGTKDDASKKIPMVGTRTLAASKFADAIFPMTLSAQESYVIYDRTQKKTIVFNVVTCLKGQDAANSEKTDWVGEANPASGKYDGNLSMIRKYDRQGPPLKAPYAAMGHDFPIYIHADHSCTVQYEYFGGVKLTLTQHEVPDALLKKIVDDHDSHFRTN
jgi:hypothetical protein